MKPEKLFNAKTQRRKGAKITIFKSLFNQAQVMLSPFLKTFAPLRLCVFALIFFSVLFTFSCDKPKVHPKPISKVTTLYGMTEKIGEPFGIAVKADEIFVSDGETGRILRIAKNGSASTLTDRLDTPSQIVFDRNGDLIVADSGTSTIKKIKPDGAVELVAGVENNPGFQDGDVKSALFNAPVGVAVFGEKIFVADTYNDKIRVIENGRVSTLAGSSEGFADGAGVQAKFDTPCGIAATAGGKIIVADTNNRRLRIVEPDGQTRTLAGNGAANLVDGNLSEAVFVQPIAVTIDRTGTLYIADGNAIRKIETTVFPVIKTISGQRRGFADGDLRGSRFNRPSGLAADEKGNLFVADSENQTVRVFTGEEIGQALTAEEIENARVKAEDFRKFGEPRWPYNPPENKREIAGTLGEIRGELVDRDSQVWFHNGLDVVGGYGETARFVRPEKVLNPIATENFATLRELLRLPNLGYIHIRLGRDGSDRPFGDKRFLFSKDESSGKLTGVRIPRGAKFLAGEPIGTLNPMNHVHLIAGRSGAEMNSLDALTLPGISDKIPPVIETVSVFDENWREIETSKAAARITLNGKTRIVVKAYDRMDGNAERRRLGVFQIGYQILKDDKTPVTDQQWTIRFDRLPEPDAVKLVYAPGSKSGATGETIFNYIATNKVHGNVANEDFFDAAQLGPGNYVLRVFAADYFGNTTFKDVAITKN
jgi:sugar lactone lactonase YvrE